MEEKDLLPLRHGLAGCCLHLCPAGRKTLHQQDWWHIPCMLVLSTKKSRSWMVLWSHSGSLNRLAYCQWQDCLWEDQIPEWEVWGSVILEIPAHDSAQKFSFVFKATKGITYTFEKWGGRYSERIWCCHIRSQIEQGIVEPVESIAEPDISGVHYFTNHAIVRRDKETIKFRIVWVNHPYKN